MIGHDSIDPLVNASREDHSLRLRFIFGEPKRKSSAYKPGDMVITLDESDPFYNQGDTAYLVCQDRSGDWWADFRHNDNFYGMGVWCIGKPRKHFKRFTEEPAK